MILNLVRVVLVLTTLDLLRCVLNLFSFLMKNILRYDRDEKISVGTDLIHLLHLKLEKKLIVYTTTLV